MNQTKPEHEKLLRDARKWARGDPTDPYREILLEEVLNPSTPYALVELAKEMAHNS